MVMWRGRNPDEEWPALPAPAVLIRLLQEHGPAGVARIMRDGAEALSEVADALDPDGAPQGSMKDQGNG